jgi:hypothetical protein
MPPGAFSPAHSAMVQQFLRARSGSSPSTGTGAIRTPRPRTTVAYLLIAVGPGRESRP